MASVIDETHDVIGRDDFSPVMLVAGETRSFLQDGDELLLLAHTHANDRVSIGFGECRGLPEGWCRLNVECSSQPELTLLNALPVAAQPNGSKA